MVGVTASSQGTPTVNNRNRRAENEPFPQRDDIRIRIEENTALADPQPVRERVIDDMAAARRKPRALSRLELVPPEVRIYNDRRWADHDREDQQRREDREERRELAAMTTPRRSWWQRLFGR